MIPLRSLLGVAGVPNHRTAAGQWAQRQGIKIEKRKARGGLVDCVNLANLPEPVRLAYQARQAERSGLAAGVQDEAAHLAYMAKPLVTRQEGERRAKIIVFERKHRQVGLKWPEIAKIFETAGIGEWPSKQTFNRWLKKVENVDPINWAPALAPGYSTQGAPLAACHPDAWSHFECAVAASGNNGTGVNFRQVHAKTKVKAEENGWAFPPYRTVMRHWAKMAVERQRTLEDGAEAAARSLTHYFPRSLSGMFAMEQAEVDFREFKVKCIWPDGTIGCPWVGLSGDRASSKIVGWTIQKSETAEGYVALTRNMVETHGIPDRVVQDNGAGGNGYRMMGGKTPLVRRKDKGERSAEWALPGVYEFLGIEVVNHGPRMAWAKFVESLNSALRHVDNDPAFHRAQRSGPTDAPNPDPVPVLIAVFEAVLKRAIDALNADTESRAQGLQKGESRNAAFQRLSAGRTARWPSPLQLRWMRLSWHRHKVTNAGQVKHDGYFWGDGTTQKAMLHYADQWVVIGIEPDNPLAPAMIYEWNDAERAGRLLLDALPAVPEARHNDQASKQRAQAEKHRAKKAAKAHEISGLDAWVAAERTRILEEMGQPVPERPAPKVTGLTAGGPLKAGEARHKPAQMDARKKTELLFALKAEGERTASGATR